MVRKYNIFLLFINRFQKKRTSSSAPIYSFCLFAYNFSTNVKSETIFKKSEGGVNKCRIYFIILSLFGFIILFFLVLTPNHYVDFAVILSSCEDVISAEVPFYLEKIASLLKDNLNAHEFCQLSGSAGLDWIRKYTSVKNILDEFLNKHGHRSLNEVNLVFIIYLCHTFNCDDIFVIHYSP